MERSEMESSPAAVPAASVCAEDMDATIRKPVVDSARQGVYPEKETALSSKGKGFLEREMPPSPWHLSSAQPAYGASHHDLENYYVGSSSSACNTSGTPIKGVDRKPYRLEAVMGATSRTTPHAGYAATKVSRGSGPYGGGSARGMPGGKGRFSVRRPPRISAAEAGVLAPPKLKKTTSVQSSTSSAPSGQQSSPELSSAPQFSPVVQRSKGLASVLLPPPKVNVLEAPKGRSDNTGHTAAATIPVLFPSVEKSAFAGSTLPISDVAGLETIKENPVETPINNRSSGVMPAPFTKMPDPTVVLIQDAVASSDKPCFPSPSSALICDDATPVSRKENRKDDGRELILANATPVQPPKDPVKFAPLPQIMHGGVEVSEGLSPSSTDNKHQPAGTGLVRGATCGSPSGAFAMAKKGASFSGNKFPVPTAADGKKFAALSKGKSSSYHATTGPSYHGYNSKASGSSDYWQQKGVSLSSRMSRSPVAAEDLLSSRTFPDYHVDQAYLVIGGVAPEDFPLATDLGENWVDVFESVAVDSNGGALECGLTEGTPAHRERAPQAVSPATRRARLMTASSPKSLRTTEKRVASSEKSGLRRDMPVLKEIHEAAKDRDSPKDNVDADADRAERRDAHPSVVNVAPDATVLGADSSSQQAHACLGLTDKDLQREGKRDSETGADQGTQQQQFSYKDEAMDVEHELSEDSMEDVDEMLPEDEYHVVAGMQEVSEAVVKELEDAVVEPEEDYDMFASEEDEELNAASASKRKYHDAGVAESEEESTLKNNSTYAARGQDDTPDTSARYSDSVSQGKRRDIFLDFQAVDLISALEENIAIPSLGTEKNASSSSKSGRLASEDNEGLMSLLVQASSECKEQAEAERTPRPRGREWVTTGIIPTVAKEVVSAAPSKSARPSERKFSGRKIGHRHQRHSCSKEEWHQNRKRHHRSNSYYSSEGRPRGRKTSNSGRGDQKCGREKSTDPPFDRFATSAGQKDRFPGDDVRTRLFSMDSARSRCSSASAAGAASHQQACSAFSASMTPRNDSGPLSMFGTPSTPVAPPRSAQSSDQ
ncbi:unnamed protein product [Amoebophrya sp. A25]|nr:unnamed protein product [Amoebophrya sp. A25]|eukprot:GSA25T00011386001.1